MPGAKLDWQNSCGGSQTLKLASNANPCWGLRWCGSWSYVWTMFNAIVQQYSIHYSDWGCWVIVESSSTLYYHLPDIVNTNPMFWSKSSRCRIRNYRTMVKLFDAHIPMTISSNGALLCYTTASAGWMTNTPRFSSPTVSALSYFSSAGLSYSKYAPRSMPASGAIYQQ